MALACPGLLTGQADDPLAGIGDLLGDGRYAEAMVRAKEAQRVYSLSKDRRKEGACWLILGQAELISTDFTAAADDLKKGAAMLEEAGDLFSAWMALWTLGTLEKAQKQPEDALTYQSRGLALLRALEDSSQPFSSEGLTYLGKFFGMPEELLQWLPTQSDRAKPILLQIAEVMSRNGAADALGDDGRFEEAEAELTRAASLSRLLGGLFDQEIAIRLGSLRRQQWRLDEAREIFRKILDSSRPSPTRETRLKTLGQLTELEIAAGRLDEALAWNDKAVELAKRIGEPMGTAEALAFRAAILDETDLAAAEDALVEALAVGRQAGNPRLQALIQHQLGSLAMKADHPEKAAAHFESAIQLFQEIDAPEQEAGTWRGLFRVYSLLASHSNATAALERARKLSAKSRVRSSKAMTDVFTALEKLQSDEGNVSEFEESFTILMELPEAERFVPRSVILDRQALLSNLVSMINSGSLPATFCNDPARKAAARGAEGVVQSICGFLLYRRGEIAAARALWLAALNEGPRREIEVSLLRLIGLSYKRERRFNRAIQYLERAVDVLERSVEDVRIEEFLAGYMGEGSRQDLFSELVETLLQKGRIAKAFSYAERARARAFLQGLGNPRLNPRGGADAKLAREAETLRSRIVDLERQAVSASPGEQERLSSELDHVRRSYQALLVRLKVSDSAAASFAKVEPLRVQAVRDELPPDTTLISYFVSSTRVHAWVLDKETFRHVALPLGPADLRPAVCWAERVGHFGGSRGARPLDIGCGATTASPEDLYRKLIAPLAGSIKHRRLILVPHGDLHYLPFAALRNPRTGLHLVEEHVLSYAPSASALLFLRAKETAVAGKALVLGEPESPMAGLAPLPAARMEATAVARRLGTTPLLGRRASESALYELHGQVDLIHIAAHGIYEPGNPLFSRIVLAPGNGHDGNLEVHEILADLDLSGVNLVVLSACRTADGERSGGDEVVGLTQAFLDAGSPGVISTLWEIDDDASAFLMEELYSRLLAGTSAADALQQAQLTLLHQPRYRDPYFWAAFNLTGNPQGRWSR